MVMRSLRAVWLITILSLSTLSAAARPPDTSPSGEGFSAGGEARALRTEREQQAGTPITFDDYWDRVRNTRLAVGGMESRAPSEIRQELDTLAAQWEQVTAVELPDHNVLPVDSSYLVAELRSAPPDLERLGSLLDALLRAHEEYPQKVFTPEDILPLHEILARPEFQWQKPQPLQLPDWLTNLYDRIAGFFDWIILKVANLIYEGRTVLKIAAALFFLLALYFISRSLSHNLVRETELPEQEENDALLTSKGAFKRAEALSMQGDYRNAIRYLYLSSLLVLDEQGLMRYDRSRTNREYLRSVSSKPELAQPLRAVIDVFDRVWYGFEGVDEQTYQSYVERVDELREKKE